MNPNTTETKIDRAGRIFQNNNLVATIQVTDFEDYNYIEKYGENMFRTVEGATEREPAADVYQGYLEASNVETVSEMVQMIAITRAYETNQKVIQTYDNSLQITANQIGKI